MITLNEHGKVGKTEKGTAEDFNNFFGNIVKNLNIFQHFYFDPIIDNVKDPTLKAILKYKKHTSILVITTKCNRNCAFGFKEVSFKQIKTEINLLKRNKTSLYSDISIKIIKENSYIFSNFICQSINNFIKTAIFSSCFKTADVTSLHKKSNKSINENYSPIRLLPILSKVFERSMFKDI